MDLHHQRVVVLGGTSGIGFATAKAVACLGAQVTVVSSRAVSVDRAVADLPPGTDGRAADLTDADQVGRLFDDLGDIDHLVYTAGEPLALTSLDTLRVNAVSPGIVRSPLWDSMTQDSRDQLYRDTAAAIPAGRVGEVDDIAQTFLYCLTQPFATGSILTVDAAPS